MKLTQTRPSAGFYGSAVLLLSAAMLVGCEAPPRIINGVTYAPVDAKPQSLVIERQEPASIALTMPPAPVAKPAEAAPAPAAAPAATTPATDSAPATSADTTSAPATTAAADTTSAPATAPAAPAAEAQPVYISPLNLDRKLSVNLATGSIVFTDTDGSSYTTSIDKSELGPLKALVEGKTWCAGYVWDPSAQPGNEALFTAIAYTKSKKTQQNQPLYERALWLRPSPKALPDTVKQLQDFYVTQERKYHPLSEEINLLD